MATDKDLADIQAAGDVVTSLDATDLFYLLRDPSGTPADKVIAKSDLATELGGVSSLESLTDTTITSIASGELLIWNGTAWVNNTLAEAGIAAVGGSPTFTSVTIDSLSNNTLVASNGSGALVSVASSSVDGSGNVTFGGNVTIGALSTLHAASASLRGAGSSGSEVSIHTASTAERSGFSLIRSRGTVGGETAVQNGDSLGFVGFKGFDGSGPQLCALVEAFVDGAVSVGAVPARVSIVTGSNSATRAERLRIDSGGDVSVLGGQLDLLNGSIALLVGADSGQSTRTNNTIKDFRLGAAHYTNAEEPVCIAVGNVQSGSSLVAIGGGSSVLNAATEVAIFVAATPTTVTGTKTVSITPSLVDITGDVSYTGSLITPLTSNALTYVNSSGALVSVSGSVTSANGVTTLPIDVGSQVYHIRQGLGTTNLGFQSQTSGQQSGFEVFSKDGDGTDNIFLNLYRLGTPANAATTHERLQFLGLTSPAEFWIQSQSQGSGTLRPLVIFTAGNTDQLRLNTDGTVTFSAGKITASEGLTSPKAITLSGAGVTDGVIEFSGTNGGGGEGITYPDAVGGSQRYALFFPGSDIVALANRAANGKVQIRANNATAGGAGEVTVAEFSPALADITGAIQILPGSSVTPVANGNLVFEATNNTTITLKLKGSDGTVRSGTVALSP